MAYRTTGRDSKAVTDVMRWEVWNRDDFTCVVCGSRMFLEVDHVLPLSKGGSSHLGNLQTLCQNCNVRKKDHSRNLAPGESCDDPDCGHVVARKPYETLPARLRDIQDDLDWAHEHPWSQEIPLDL